MKKIIVFIIAYVLCLLAAVYSAAAADIDISCISASVSENEFSRDQSFNVRVANSIGTKTDVNATLYAALIRNGELVSETVTEPNVEMTQWESGIRYTQNISLKIPFNAPTGEYTVICGVGSYEETIAYTNTDTGYKVVKNIVIGELQSDNAVSIDYSGLSVDFDGTGFDISGIVTADGEEQKAKLYIGMYKGEELHSISEGDEISLTYGTNEISQRIQLDSGLSDGEYTCYLGMFNV